MRYKVVQHLDRLQLNVFGYSASSAHQDLLSRLKSSSWCKYKKPEYPGSRRVDLFTCPRSSARFALVLCKDYFFVIQLYNVTLDLQSRMLAALHAVLAAHSRLDVSLSQVEFALDFYPARATDLPDLLHMLSSSVVLQHGRADAYRCNNDDPDEPPTHYQGNRGYVRNRTIRYQTEDGQQQTKKRKCSKGLQVYRKKRCKVRVELNCNNEFLKKKGLGVHSLPLSPDSVNVLDNVTFRKSLDNRSLKHLVEVVVRRRERVRGAYLSEMAHAVRSYAIEGVIRRKFTDGMVTAMNTRKRRLVVGDSDQTGEYPEFDFELDELPVPLQVSVVKKLKKERGFTNQTNEFFPVNERLTKNVRRHLRRRA